jgi:hypothetical protein
MSQSQRDYSPRSDWPTGITRLLNETRTDVEQLLNQGRIQRAIDMSRATGLTFDAGFNPMYFTGAFESPFVLVHLNPKLSEQLAKCRYRDFDDYCAKHRNFGLLHWGANPAYSSPFDLKQVRFIRPFNAICFLPESEAGHKRANAAMAIDEKLQLELIPYASQSFDTAKFSMAVLKPHFGRVLDAISAYPRKYVLFCGAVFDDLIEKSGLLTSRTDHRFHLPTKSGQSKNEYQYSNVEFSLAGVNIRAGIARSFATQGLPMDAYGAVCSELYGADWTSS